MAGHSKWHQIRHKKAANDVARGKVLTKHSKILMVLGRNDPNPQTNTPLKNAINNAKSDGVPKDNIEKILKKLSGTEKDGVQYTEVVYEGFGPEGIPFLVQALTDNTNRTFPEVRTVFEKNGGKLGNNGSVKFLFEQKGVIYVPTQNTTESALFETAIECGAQDFIFDPQTAEIITVFEELAVVLKALEDKKIPIEKSQPEYRIKDPISIKDNAKLEKIQDFMEKLETIDDVDDIWPGFEIDDALTD
jgi:YebC/PmpR family DNA-binding regulatory protein